MASRVLQLKVTLRDTKPAIWRRILVSEDMTLADLHLILQVVMGWQNYHLHGFTIRGQRFGLPSRDDYTPVVDERKHRIGALLHKGSKFTYEYDYGDGWEHIVAVGAVREASPGEALASCLAGARACPPEDCGGAWGYADLLDALADPRTERHKELLEWIGGTFDADRFELGNINDALADLMRPPPPRKAKPRSKGVRSKKTKSAQAKSVLH